MRPCALGQVMMREGLDKCGVRVERNNAKDTSTFNFLFCLTCVYFVFSYAAASLVGPYYQVTSGVNEEGNFKPANSLTDAPSWVGILNQVRHLVDFAFYLYVLLLTIRTRQHIRKRYQIPVAPYGACEDCCVAFCVPCCATLQMMHHTADYQRYKAACCSETGLAATTPVVV